jgi:hypothetical protein
VGEHLIAVEIDGAAAYVAADDGQAACLAERFVDLLLDFLVDADADESTGSSSACMIAARP